MPWLRVTYTHEVETVEDYIAAMAEHRTKATGTLVWDADVPAEWEEQRCATEPGCS